MKRRKTYDDSFKARVALEAIKGENEADLKDVPQKIIARTKFIKVSKIDEVLANALVLRKKRKRR